MRLPSGLCCHHACPPDNAQRECCIRTHALLWLAAEAPSPAAAAVSQALPPTCFHPCPLPPALQKEGSEKPVSDQWLEPFVIVGEDDAPVGTVQDGEHLLPLHARLVS